MRPARARSAISSASRIAAWNTCSSCLLYTSATSGSGPVNVSLKPPDPGPYRIRANFSGAQSDAGATDVQAFAFGPGVIDWGGAQTTTVDVHLDKKTYKVGESAKVLIASPFDRSDVYVAVVRNDVLYATTLHDVKGAPTRCV